MLRLAMVEEVADTLEAGNDIQVLEIFVLSSTPKSSTSLLTKLPVVPETISCWTEMALVPTVRGASLETANSVTD